MEIGQKITQNNNISDPLNELSIQVSLSGLSFFVLNPITSNIEYLEAVCFDKKQTPQELLDHLIHQFNSTPELNKAFSKLSVIHSNELATLVPKPLFDESNLVDYLKFNSKILKTDFITYDLLKIADIMVVYVPLVNINNFIFERFGSFEYKHSSSILINRVLTLEKNTKHSKMYINIEASHFEIVVVENNFLKFYNRFEYSSKEDFIYYLLFTAEQLQLNPEEFPAVLMGSISESDVLYEIAYTYIRHISLLPKESMLYTKDGSSKYFTLLNSL
tara:strand:- start:544 stop:1368 length:825 start_codon:yes stop_codon:yes gene_type:complete